MSNQSWVLCPICNNKTRTKIRDDTELINVPLFCPKCKQETLINLIMNSFWSNDTLPNEIVQYCESIAVSIKSTMHIFLT